ncbi:MAG: hypothetical protein IJZ35_06720 [Clostridia bacterium]|nr:hypothetical protein [Clostridia bacterium]
MNTDKILRSAIGLLAKTIIFSIPEKNFTTAEKADKYMLSGDKRFSSEKGKYFTCGFGKAVLTPADASSGKYFIAGYDSANPACGVLDDIYARAVYVDDNTGRGGVVMCAVDAVGISRKDINLIRKAVIESGRIPGLKSINICATHSHSSIDTQGLWGEKIYKCGRNEEFMEFLRQKTAQAVIAAYENRADGRLFYSVKKTEDMQYDCRTPDTFDPNLTKIRFEAFDGSENICIVNFASHAELMGSKTKSISADFPAYMIKEIEENNPDCNAVFFNGAIGGMISAKEIRQVYRNAIDCEAYTKQFGKMLGEIVNSLTDEKELAPLINVKSVPVKIVAANFVLILARFLKVLNNDIFRSSNRTQAYIFTEAGYLELGNEEIGMFLIPGELFPELYNGEFLSEEASATGMKAQYKILREQSNAKHTFVVGLCNDELGYIIPENDFYLNPRMPYINSGNDRFDRNHYEETNSTGPETARTILDATDRLISSAKGDS